MKKMNENEKLFKRYKGLRQNETNLKLQYDNSQIFFDKLLSKTIYDIVITMKKCVQTAQINFGMK